jgi:type IV secretory pathway VirD2 relaxase
MPRDDDSSFRVSLGKPRASKGRDDQLTLSFTQQVARAVVKQGGDPRRLVRNLGSRIERGKGSNDVDKGLRSSGRFNARGRGRHAAAGLPRENAWSAPDRGMRFRARRVVVKARVVKISGSKSQPADSHLRYLQRDGVTRDGERGQVYTAFTNSADARQFCERGRGDRHQFRFIVAPEDSAELGDLKPFTRNLMREIEQDLDTELDWVAVDHHNTGHPHTHVIIRGVTDDGKILNIAGDYIAHGVRARASELVTIELGHQSEWEVQQKLGLELNQDRFTRLDRVLLQEVNTEHVVDLRPGNERSYLGRTNRYLLIDRLKKLERLGIAAETGVGTWSLSPRIEATLKEMGERGDIIKTMHRALHSHGIERSPERYIVHLNKLESPIVGRLVGKGLAGDELNDRVHLVIDGADGRAHYVEIAEASRVNDVPRRSIVEVAPEQVGPRNADRAIAALARDTGIYRPREHLAIARQSVRVLHDDQDGYIEAHVRRLEALRRAGIVERINSEHWRIPDDFESRAAAYDIRQKGLVAVRVHSTIDLDAQARSEGATWLDRQLLARHKTQPAPLGFGLEVINALEQRQATLIAKGHAQRGPDGQIQYRRDLLVTLERQELMRVGQKLAEQRQLQFRTIQDGERVRGIFKETVQLASGKYALVQNEREFSLVPWRPVIDKDVGEEISGVMRGNSVSWNFGRRRGLEI